MFRALSNVHRLSARVLASKSCCEDQVVWPAYGVQPQAVLQPFERLFGASALVMERAECRGRVTRAVEQ